MSEQYLLWVFLKTRKCFKAGFFPFPFFFPLQCGCAPKSLSLPHNSSQGRESIRSRAEQKKEGAQSQRKLHAPVACSRSRSLPAVASLRLASRADGDAVLKQAAAEETQEEREEENQTDRPSERALHAARSNLARAGAGDPLTSPSLMLGYFGLFFFRPPSPMQTEICGEASPSSSPVCWGCAWLPA